MTTNRYAAQTPAAIDARLAEVESEAAALRARLEVLDAEAAAIATEYRRRGGWTRSYLVSGGHLHKTTACSTCYPTTSFYFLPALSGSDEAQIVEEAGERACTVCFPSAPVDVLRRPSALRTPDEAKAEAERAEREQARAKRAAEAIVVEGLAEYRGRAHTFKSERALSNFVASQASSLAAWGEGHPTAPVWTSDLRIAATVLAEVRGTDVEALIAEARSKADKRVAAERRRAGL